MRAIWDDVPLLGITRRAVAKLHAAYEDRPWRGNAILRTLRLVMNFGRHSLELPDLANNPAERHAHYDTPARGRVWSQREIDEFMATAAGDAAGRRVLLALALLLYSIQRPADVLSMTRPQIATRDGRAWIALRQEKTGALMDVPCHQRLAAVLREAPPGEMLLLPSPRGRPWTYRNFARAWDRIRRRTNWRLARAALRAARLPSRFQARARAEGKARVRALLLHDLQRRDLRRTGVVQMARAGATTSQIAALGGWSIDYTQRIIDTYLPRHAEVALAGVEAWERSEGAGRVVALAAGRRRPK